MHEARAAFDAVWAGFQGAKTTLGLDPGAREAWARGRARYAVWAFRIDAPEVVARMMDAGHLLAEVAPGLRPTRPEETHITVFVAGFPCAVPRFDDDVAEAALEAQRDALLGLRAPRLAIGGLNSFLSAAFLEVYDLDGGLAQIRAALGGSASEIRFAPYLPHVTVGVLPISVPTAPLAARIAALRDPPRLPIAPDALDLVCFSAETAHAPLETAWRVPLRAP